MKILTFSIRYFLDSFRDTSRIVRFFKLTKLNNFFVIFKIFFIRFFYGFSFIRNFTILTLNLKLEGKYNIDFFEKYPSDKLVEEIDKKGHSEIFNINNNLINAIKNDIFFNQNADSKDKNFSGNLLLKQNEENLEDYFLRLRNNNISRLTGHIDLRKSSSIKNLLTSELFLKIVSKYLNSKNFSINASYFLSSPIPITKEQKYANAQYFHWDNDFTKFLKLYIYLTDVDESSGPHIFIPYTHKYKLKQHRLCRLYSDDNIYSAYDDKVVFKGVAGSCFFVDSYGLHKGETPDTKSRMILNVHYGRNKILYSPGDIHLSI